jgi:branched-subunit amino acid aminotransferase/4-amino-4-deoxychorismate lyase
MNETFIEPAFLYGESVFTTCLIENGVIQLWPEHQAQLLNNAKTYFFLSNEIVEKLSQDLVLVITSIDLSEKKVMRVSVFESAMGEYSIKINFRKFVLPPQALKLKTFIRTQDQLLDDLKIGSYGKEFYLKKLAKNLGFDDCLFCDEKYIYETTTANIFFTRGDEIFTPKSRIYKGILRQKIINYNKVQERDIFVDELSDFDGAFISNSILKFFPIQQINNFKFNKVNLNLDLGE